VHLGSRRLVIRYRTGEDEYTTREISDIYFEAPNAIRAHCHLREETRTFVIDRICQATDPATGEILDIRGLLGLPPRSRPERTLPTFPLPIETSSNRKWERRKLFACFKLEVIAQVKRRQLLEMFDNRCFRCDTAQDLNFDHHWPIEKGGRLIPGNVMILCGPCNNLKRARLPEDFYSPAELTRAHALLLRQLDLFDFKFDWTGWTNHPKEYLVAVGATSEEAEAALSAPGHPLYAGGYLSFLSSASQYYVSPDQESGLVVTIGIDSGGVDADTGRQQS